MKPVEPPYGETPLSPDELEALLPDARYVLGGDTINKLAPVGTCPWGAVARHRSSTHEEQQPSTGSRVGAQRVAR